MRKSRLVLVACVSVLFAAAGGVAAAAPAVPKRDQAPVLSTPSSGSNLKTFLAPYVGEVFNASTGTWTGSPTSYSYVWQDCNVSASSCGNISGATTSTYTLASGDVGFYVRVGVTASNSAGVSTVVSYSGLSGLVPGAVPSNTVLPTISGSYTQGQTLTSTNGAWSGSPTSYVRSWQDCTGSGGTGCANLSGATATTYVLTSGDVGKYVRSGVAAVNGAGTGTVAYSTPTSIVTAPSGSAPTNTVLPLVTGTATVGQTLSTTTGTWTGTAPITYTYQWGQQTPCGPGAGTDITGATSSSYVLASGQVGAGVYAAVTATNAFGSVTTYTGCSAAVSSGGGGGGTSGYTGPCTTTINPSTANGYVASAEAGMSPGQVLCLNTGTYGTISTLNNFEGSGTATNRIVVTAGPGQAVTLVGAQYVGNSGAANYITLENLNIDNSNNQYNAYGGAVPSACALPEAEAILLDGTGNTLTNDNIYTATASLKDIQIVVGSQVAGGSATITHNKISNTGQCGQTQHLVYMDNVSSGTVSQNWMWDTAFGACVQLYPQPRNVTLSSNVFDGCMFGTFDWNGGGSFGGNTTTHNVFENLVQDPATGPASGDYGGVSPPFGGQKAVACTGNAGATETVSNNALFNVANGIGAGCSGFSTTGTQTLSVSPFVSEHTHNYAVASGSAGTPVAGYGLWDGTGPPTPDPAPANTVPSSANNSALTFTNP